MQNCFSQVLITSRKEELCAVLCLYGDSWWENDCGSCQSPSASTSSTSIIPSASELIVHFHGLTLYVHSNDILTSNIYVIVNVAQWATISFIFHKFLFHISARRSLIIPGYHGVPQVLQTIRHYLQQAAKFFFKTVYSSFKIIWPLRYCNLSYCYVVMRQTYRLVTGTYRFVSYRIVLTLYTCTLKKNKLRTVMTFVERTAHWTTLSPVVTLQRFDSHSVFMCFGLIWEQTAIISLYNINWLVCVTETDCVYCAVRTG